MLYRERKQNGDWSKPRSQRLALDQIPRLPDPADREIMALLVGANTVVDLRLLGVASNLPLEPLERFFSIMWLGFWINAASGLLLLIAYPTKAFTNPIFYIKLSLIALAVITMQRIKNRVFVSSGLSEAARVARGKMMAKLSLGLWIGAITAGRLLAYTYTYRRYGSRIAH